MEVNGVAPSAVQPGQLDLHRSASSKSTRSERKQQLDILPVQCSDVQKFWSFALHSRTVFRESVHMSLIVIDGDCQNNHLLYTDMFIIAVQATLTFAYWVSGFWRSWGGPNRLPGDSFGPPGRLATLDFDETGWGTTRGCPSGLVRVRLRVPPAPRFPHPPIMNVR